MEMTPKLKQAVKEYKSGKAESFETLYKESEKYIYTCIYKIMSGNNNAWDITKEVMQDTYLEIVLNISQLENEDKFLSWAGTIARRKCFAHIKKNEKYVLLNEDDDTFENLSDSDDIIPEEVMQSREKQRLVREIIDTQLTEVQKICVYDYYYSQLKQSEIAELYGIPLNTVKTNLSRAKAKIEDGVLDLEKNKGTKLVAFAPLFVLLFTEDVMAAEVPAEVGAGVLSSVADASAKAMGVEASTSVSGATEGAGASTGGATTTTSTVSATSTVASKAGVLGKIAAASVKAKIIGGIVGVGILGAVAGGTYMATQKDVPVETNSGYVEEYAEPSDNLTNEEFEQEENLTGNPFEEGSWQYNYYGFLVADYGSGRCKGFDLHDFDEDGIPELVAIYNGEIIVAYFTGDGIKEVDADFLFLEEDSVGYGSKASELISYYEYTEEDGRDSSSYTLYDNYSFVEQIWPSMYIEEDDYSITIVYGRDAADGTYGSITYEEAQAKIQKVREGYQKIDFKEIDRDVIKETLENY